MDRQSWSDIAEWYDELIRAGSGPHQLAVETTLRLVPQLAGFSLLVCLGLASCGSPGGQSVAARCRRPSRAISKRRRRSSAFPEDQEFSAEGERILCDKAEVILAEREEIEEGQQDFGEPQPASEPSPTYYEEDIFGEEEANERPGFGYKYENMWRGVVDEFNIAVSAGYRVGDPSIGVILLAVGDPFTGGAGKRTVIDAPIPGPLIIVSANNADIRIHSKSTGERVVFDASRREWKRENAAVEPGRVL